MASSSRMTTSFPRTNGSARPASSPSSSSRPSSSPRPRRPSSSIASTVSTRSSSSQKTSPPSSSSSTPPVKLNAASSEASRKRTREGSSPPPTPSSSPTTSEPASKRSKPNMIPAKNDLENQKQHLLFQTKKIKNNILLALMVSPHCDVELIPFPSPGESRMTLIRKKPPPPPQMSPPQTAQPQPQPPARPSVSQQSQQPPPQQGTVSSPLELQLRQLSSMHESFHALPSRPSTTSFRVSSQQPSPPQTPLMSPSISKASQQPPQQGTQLPPALPNHQQSPQTTTTPSAVSPKDFAENLFSQIDMIIRWTVLSGSLDLIKQFVKESYIYCALAMLENSFREEGEEEDIVIFEVKFFEKVLGRVISWYKQVEFKWAPECRFTSSEDFFRHVYNGVLDCLQEWHWKCKHPYGWMIRDVLMVDSPFFERLEARLSKEYNINCWELEDFLSPSWTKPDDARSPERVITTFLSSWHKTLFTQNLSSPTMFVYFGWLHRHPKEGMKGICVPSKMHCGEYFGEKH